ncbi:hypothetical protein GQF42_32230 [Streptomyces broussonetiae]|uniref:WD40 repeat domain-containing protein n=1 Tax=Streptomyces broussonetiae TaxID=2686304 RepID=A0A6I6N3P4_9ACTN|nr:hypothetical protein [Streptomyces broussonetiae]QHA07353.1 hypothetical protein GQF42_32230 [Streptomyces broussonetiae]
MGNGVTACFHVRLVATVGTVRRLIRAARSQKWGAARCRGPAARPRGRRTAATPAMAVGSMSHVLLSPDGRLMALQAGEDKVEIRNLLERTRLGTLPGNLGGFANTVASSPDDTTYATYDRVRSIGSKGGINSLRLYDLRTVKLIRKMDFTLKASLFMISTTVVFRPDGKAVTVSPLLGTVAVPSGRFLVHGTPDLRLDGLSPWGLQTRRQLGPALTGPADAIALTTFTRDNSTLVTLDDKGVFRTCTVAPSRLVRPADRGGSRIGSVG